MSLQSMIEKPAEKAPSILITGDAGTGKTTLACSFPKPLVIRAEDGLQAIPVESRPDALPVIESVDNIYSQLKLVLNEDHDYKTLIIDSVSQLELIFIKDILEKETKPVGINQALGGYGAGQAAVAAMHQRVRKACSMIQKKHDMNIIFIAHADTEVLDLPDTEPYSRYNLKLMKKSTAYYVDDVDLVCFLKLQTFTDKKKAISDGTRLAVCYATAANISKNRFGITDDITVKQGENPFINKFYIAGV